MATSIAHLSAGRAEGQWHASYPLSDPSVNLEEYPRLAHRYLTRLDVRQLERVRYRARHRALLDDAPAPWQAERLAALDAELGRRGRRWAR